MHDFRAQGRCSTVICCKNRRKRLLYRDLSRACHRRGAGVQYTVPLTSNLTRCARVSRVAREFSCRLSRDELATLARTLGYTRENTGLHSREHWATLARTLGYTRENTGLHSREHWATLARTLGYTREATWLHSRGHLATLARTISYTRELHTRGHLATVTLARPLGYSNTREATWLARLHSRGHCIDEADIIMGATRRGAALL